MSSISPFSASYHPVSEDSTYTEGKEVLKNEKKLLIVKLAAVNSAALAAFAFAGYMIYGGNKSESDCYANSDCTWTGHRGGPWNCPNGNPCVEAGSTERTLGIVIALFSGVGSMVFDFVKGSRLSNVLSLLKINIDEITETMKAGLQMNNTPKGFYAAYGSTFEQLIELTIFTKDDRNNLYGFIQRCDSLKKEIQGDASEMLDSHFTAPTGTYVAQERDVDTLVQEWNEFKQGLVGKLTIVITP